MGEKDGIGDPVRNSVCYVVPSLCQGEHQHFAHLPPLISELGKSVRTYVIVQRSTGDVDIPNARWVLRQRFAERNHLLRAAEFLYLAIRVRRRGCRRFFVRISLSACLPLCLLSPILRIRVYYWNSTQSKITMAPWARSPVRRLRAEIRLLPQYAAMRLAYRLVTGPESMVRYFQENYHVPRQRIVLLYNDIDLSTIDGVVRSGIHSGSELLFVGRVSFLKGGKNLAPIVHSMLLSGREVSLKVVGEVQLPEVLDEMRETGLQDFVHFLGKIPNSELADLYRAADVCIVPSESEGFPRVLLEAMAYGTPFVVFDVGGVRDLLDAEQMQCLIPKGDVKRFADAVVRLLVHPELREHLAAVGRQQVQRYSTERVAQMFVQEIVRS